MVGEIYAPRHIFVAASYSVAAIRRTVLLHLQSGISDGYFMPNKK